MMDPSKDNGAKWGNRLGFIILPFHIAMHDDPLEYVRKAKKTVDRKKCSLEVIFTHAVAETVLQVFGIKVYIWLRQPRQSSTINLSYS